MKDADKGIETTCLKSRLKKESAKNALNICFSEDANDNYRGMPSSDTPLK